MVNLNGIFETETTNTIGVDALFANTSNTIKKLRLKLGEVWKLYSMKFLK